ncbi:MAG: MurR/RpiR family transcriptional regulator [Rhizobiaceae bacterium]
MRLVEVIGEKSDSFTAAERKVASALLSDYPFAGLETIHRLADKTHVSAPSITRFVQKLGCNGYQEFQRRLIGELKEGQQSPIDLQERSAPIGSGFLRKSIERTCLVQRRVCDSVTEDQFTRVSNMLSDPRRNIFHIGGRMSDPLAQYLSRHHRQIRHHICHLPPDTELWPEYLMRMKSRDVFFIVDFRRYEQRLATLARQATQERDVTIILITDKWLSPVSEYAGEVIALPVDCGTAWDSYCGAVALIEALISHVSAQDWQSTKQRIGDWDRLRLAYQAECDDT